MTDPCALPPTPYYAVIFANRRAGPDDGYGAMAEKMATFAAEQDGFLGIDSARDADGFGITVSYWRDEAAIRAWKENAAHQVAQKLGHTRWYARFTLRVARVERQYDGPATAD
ncbi:antibiotic biosynthesis monooxygenase family protein [Oceanomicrobium pacificus]|uniref:Antibiotic biosynthesis monooxygenase n=1 Tax=Oceanomicrobium pacificus TaxID=2692916 RepID=A0A6B0TX75_9RHOB|nr:antibiotic biosynthesis monooxygenase [Oceanomicrobium pacificus]MXU65754.1 antibiotic biosynthesis monooxygenase [Oceanomicrobium pacificus]